VKGIIRQDTIPYIRESLNPQIFAWTKRKNHWYGSKKKHRLGDLSATVDAAKSLMLELNPGGNQRWYLRALQDRCSLALLLKAGCNMVAGWATEVWGPRSARRALFL
jgi:hypothetical protein